jgi:hypothetical protein
MIVSDAVQKIRFASNTNDDNTGRNINALFSNKNLISQFQGVLDQYAAFTKAIESMYTVPVIANTRSVDGPSDIIRGEGYRFIEIWLQGRRYPINIKSLNTTQTEFPTLTTSGVPQYVSVWQDEISFYPSPSSSHASTTVATEVGTADTTINVASTSNFPPQNGRLTIGEEKIKYTSLTSTTFVGCTRGIEGTNAGLHDPDANVSENNLFVYYRKKPFTITVDSSDIIFPSDMSRELEIPDEHMNGIIDLTVYNLLQKIDPERAMPYKIDAAAFLRQAKEDIQQGRSAIIRGSFIGEAYNWERSSESNFL